MKVRGRRPKPTAPRSAYARATASPGKRSPLLVALADALAGALGSVISVVAFYPIDIAKTRAQAASVLDPLHSRDKALPRPAVTVGSFFKSRTLAALASLMKEQGGILTLYEGLEAKALQSLMGSFVYFYAYDFIKGALRRRTRNATSGETRGLNPYMNLLAAALAGIVNQAFTLPLENITTRMQTTDRQAPAHDRRHRTARRDSMTPALEYAGESRHSSFNKLRVGQDEPQQSIAASRGGLGGSGQGSERSIAALPTTIKDEGSSTSEAPPESAAHNVSTSAPGEGTGARQPVQHDGRHYAGGQRQALTTVAGDLYREGKGIARFWRGFTPSLILTCNPAINYTAFDLLKGLVLRRRARVASGAAGDPRNDGGDFLSPSEAFLVAAAAKCCATLVTYPLVRAKIILMTSNVPRAPRSRQSRPPNPSAEPTTSCRAPGTRDPSQNEPAVCSPASGGGAASVTSCAASREDERNMSLTADEGTQNALHVSTEAEGTDGRAAGSNAGLSGMAHVLAKIYHQEGLEGLYAGCGAQLLHTVLKSALLLATKEQLAKAAATAVFVRGR